MYQKYQVWWKIPITITSKTFWHLKMFHLSPISQPNLSFYFYSFHLYLSLSISYPISVVSKLLWCADHLKYFSILVLRESPKFELYRDWQTTWANLADHQWSAEQTLGITDLPHCFSLSHWSIFYFWRLHARTTFYSCKILLWKPSFLCIDEK